MSDRKECENCRYEPSDCAFTAEPIKSIVTCCGKQHEVIQFATKGPIQYGVECSVCGMRHAGENPAEVVAKFAAAKEPALPDHPFPQHFSCEGCDDYVQTIGVKTKCIACFSSDNQERKNYTPAPTDPRAYERRNYAPAPIVERGYTVEEIKRWIIYYARVMSFGDAERFSLKYASIKLNDPEDGIAAVANKTKENHV